MRQCFTINKYASMADRPYKARSLYKKRKRVQVLFSCATPHLYNLYIFKIVHTNQINSKYPQKKNKIMNVDDSLNFGQAIEAMKSGKRVSRKGWNGKNVIPFPAGIAFNLVSKKKWNGKNMFLWLKEGCVINSDHCHDPILKSICDDNGGTLSCLPTICMKTADNKVLTGWLASQIDMLSCDWYILY